MMDASVLVNALLGVIGGYALGYLFFIKTIDHRWGAAKKISKHAKIKYWCGAFSAIAIGQGAATILNELIYNLSHESNIKMDKILLGVTEIILYPAVFFVIGFFLTFFLADSLKTEDLQNEFDGKENRLNLVKNTDSKNPLEQRKTILLVGAVALVCILAFRFSTGSGAGFFSTGEFKLTNCENCEFGKCQKLPTFNGFKVLDSTVQIYANDTNGAPKIVTLPSSSDMKCSFAKSKNFMFDCESSEYKDNTYRNTSISFNGANKLFWNHHLSFSGKPISEGKMTCDVQ